MPRARLWDAQLADGDGVVGARAPHSAEELHAEDGEDRLERNHDAEPKLYKKHAHYDDLRWYVAGWFARTRVKEAVFRHLDAGRFIPDSKRFKAAGEEWSQLAAAAQ